MNNVERLKNYQNRNAATIESLYRAVLQAVQGGKKTMKRLTDLNVPPRHGRRRPKKRIVKT
uniref:Uncharacterized protein n=1 Tax=Siphoviridae sp. ct2hZ16 TaxID=2826276 RepID=A0A8S5QVE9_9CAUD|nr:MAG TPA: hypothetical protein [Siphoviridae sp. ct2hZ16]